MSTVDTLIANAQAYASSASSTAAIAIDDVTSLADRVTNLQYALSTDPWVLAKVSNYANSLYGDVHPLAMPTPPADLGTLSNIPDLTDYTPEDYTDLKNTLKAAVDELEALQDRFAAAAILFDLVDHACRERINSALEVTNTEVNAAFDITIREESDKLDDDLDDILDKYAQLGHMYAPGKLSKDLHKQAKINARTASARNRELTGKYAEEAQDIAEYYGSLAVQSAVAQMGIGQEKYKALVGAARVLVNAAQAEQKDKDLEFKMYDLGFRREAAIQDSKVAIFLPTIAGWAGKLDDLARKYAAQQQGALDVMLNTDQLSLKILEDAKLRLDAYGMDTGMDIQKLLEKISLYATKLAGALSGVNSLVGQISSLTED